MVAVSEAAETDVSFAAQIANAQRELTDSITRAGLQRDPYRHLLEATAVTLGIFPELVKHLEATRLPVRDEEMRRAVINGISAHARRVTHEIKLRNRLLGALIVVLALMGGFVGGFYAKADPPPLTCQDQNGGRVCYMWQSLPTTTATVATKSTPKTPATH